MKEISVEVAVESQTFLEELSRIVGNTAMDIYLSRVLTGSLPGSCYIFSGERLEILGWLGRSVISENRSTWILDALNCDSISEYTDLIKYSLNYISCFSPKELIVECELDCRKGDLDTSVISLGGKSIGSESYYCVPSVAVRSAPQNTLLHSGWEIMSLDQCSEIVKDEMLEFLCSHYHSVPHPFTLGELTKPFMKAYFPTEHLEKKASLIAMEMGIVKAVLLVMPNDRDNKAATILITLVHPQIRGRGMGITLRHISIQKLYEQGYSDIFTLVDDNNLAVIKPYERLNARIVGHRYYHSFQF